VTDLTARIAAVLFDCGCEREDARELAGVLVAVLGLRQEHKREQTGTNVRAHRDHRLLFDPVIATRFVTPWVDNTL